MMIRKKIIFYLFLCIFNTCFIFKYADTIWEYSKNTYREISTQTNNSKASINTHLPQKNDLKCEKWIVITTISLPTEDVKYIHDTAFDWCVVVVADKKTPSDWSYKNVIFLSVEKQEKMAKNFKVYRYMIGSTKEILNIRVRIELLWKSSRSYEN